MKADTRRLVEAIAHEVEKLPTARLRALAPALAEAYGELRRELAAVVGTDKEARFTAQMFRRALIQLRPAMDRIAKLEPALAQALADGHPEASKLAYDHLVKQFEFYRDVGGTVRGVDNYAFDKSAFPIPLAQAGRLAEKSLLDHYRSSSKRYGDDVRKDIRLQLARSMLKGETPHQMAKRIAPKIAHAIDPGEAVGEALTRKYKFWADRIVRTEMVKAYNDEAKVLHDDIKRDEPKAQSEWSAILDGRVCLDCRELDGVRVPVGGTFPGGVKAPPLHPLCRCGLLLWLPGWG